MKIIDLAKNEDKEDKTVFYCSVSEKTPSVNVYVSKHAEGADLKVLAYHFYCGTEREWHQWIINEVKDELIDKDILIRDEDGESLDMSKWNCL